MGVARAAPGSARGRWVSWGVSLVLRFRRLPAFSIPVHFREVTPPASTCEQLRPPRPPPATPSPAPHSAALSRTAARHRSMPRASQTPPASGVAGTVRLSIRASLALPASSLGPREQSRAPLHSVTGPSAWGSPESSGMGRSPLGGAPPLPPGLGRPWVLLVLMCLPALCRLPVPGASSLSFLRAQKSL